MKRTLRLLRLVAVLVVALALGGCSQQPTSSTGTTPPAAGGVTVSMENFTFVPASVDIKLGDSVTWTNKDSAAHTVTGDGIDSGDLAQDKSYTQKFDTAGTFTYGCSIHPAMTGTVIVK